MSTALADLGVELGPRPGTVAQERIDAFAAVTDDPQWIHVDAERAADGPFVCMAELVVLAVS